MLLCEKILEVFQVALQTISSSLVYTVFPVEIGSYKHQQNKINEHQNTKLNWERTSACLQIILKYIGPLKRRNTDTREKEKKKNR